MFARFGGTASRKGPIQQLEIRDQILLCPSPVRQFLAARSGHLDRKSTRLNSSHSQISYAVFCLKKKKKKKKNEQRKTNNINIKQIQQTTTHLNITLYTR